MQDAAHARQDLADLNARWIAASAALSEGWSPEKARRAQEAFDAIHEYIHAGEAPVIEGPDAALVRITKGAR